MVKEICKDMTAMDYAKMHISTSITTLERLQMIFKGTHTSTVNSNQPSSLLELSFVSVLCCACAHMYGVCVEHMYFRY
jgi:hypothetical protein